MILFFLACALPTAEPTTTNPPTTDTGIEMIGDNTDAGAVSCTPTIDWDHGIQSVIGIENLVIPMMTITTPCEGRVVHMEFTVDDLNVENGDWMSTIDTHMHVSSDVDPLGTWNAAGYDCGGFCHMTWDMAPIVVDVPVRRDLTFRWAGVANGETDDVAALHDPNPDALRFTARLLWEDDGGPVELMATRSVTVLPPTE